MPTNSANSFVTNCTARVLLSGDAIVDEQKKLRLGFRSQVPFPFIVALMRNILQRESEGKHRFRDSFPRLIVLVTVAVGSQLAMQGASSDEPLSLLPLKADHPAAFGFRPVRVKTAVVPIGTVFEVTNHTGSTLIARLVGIEVKSGSNWVLHTSTNGSLLLSAPEAIPRRGLTNRFIPGLTTIELKPHESAYATIRFSRASAGAVNEPVGCGVNYIARDAPQQPWRLRVSVQPKLTGVADLSARISNYSDGKQRSPPLNTFSPTYSTLGRPIPVVSEVVSPK